MRFKDIYGQRELKERLAGGVGHGRVSHAQMFSGAEGYGTLPLAIAYAQYLNCTDRAGGDSCGVCPSCRKIGELAHPDVHFVFPVNNPKGKSGTDKPISKQFMGQWRSAIAATGGYLSEPAWYEAIEIDNKQGIISAFEAEDIIKTLSFKSFEAKYKIVIIWLPERMNVQAANRLLKTLEEPWENTVFLMVSEQPYKLLPTIISRVQNIEVPAVDDDSMALYLSGRMNVEPGQISNVCRLAGGDIIEANAILRGTEENREYFGMFVQLMRLSYEDRHMELLEWAEAAAALGREQQKRLMSYSIRLLRDSYMLTAGMPDISYLYGEEAAFCGKFAPYVNNSNIEQLVAEMEQVIRQIGQNGSGRIIFPHFALTVSKLINRI